MKSPTGRVPLRIRIGVTGHRWEGDAPGTVAEDVAAAIHRVLALCANSPSSSALTPTVVSALAEGADRLVARQVLAHPRSRLEAVLPFAPDVYCEDFTSEASRREFTDLLARASTTTIVPCGESRDLTYRSAGVEVVMRSDVIVAVWDGTSGDTGGTAEIVCVARARGLPLIWVNSRAGGLIEESGGVERPLTTDDVVPLDRVAFELLERYNNEAVRKHPDARLLDRKSLVADGEISPLLDDDRVHDVLDWVEPYFERAENVARASRRRYDGMETVLYACSALAVVVVAFQVAFFADRERIVLIEAALLAFAIFMLWAVRRRGLHDRWISARHLAEWARASFFVGVTGLQRRIELSVAQDERDAQSVWVARARAEIAYEQPQRKVTERDAPALRLLLTDGWIEDQRHYFEDAATRADSRERRSRLVTAALLGCSVVFALLHAFAVGGERAGHVWVFGSITLPVIGASVHAIGSARDYRKNAHRYQAMARELGALRPEVERAGTLRDVQAAAGRVEQVVTREAQEWFSDIRLKTPELPF